MSNTWLYVSFIFLLVTISHGCAYSPSDSTDQLNINLPVQSLDDEHLFWWYARFKIYWQENTAPDFSIDTLLADVVIEPVLLNNQENIKLWRFHRRAHRDQAGHLFSFIFYSDKNTAKSIFNNLKNRDITERLLAHGIIEKIITDNLDSNERTGIYSASDKHWSETLQLAWPFFIMGVSATWLELINQQTRQLTNNHDLKRLLETYQDVNNKINWIWYEEGNHAFIHHLNALFGYEPLGN